MTVERVPWGEGKEHLTTCYRRFLARWAKRLSWKETADAFSTTWDNVFRSVKHAVEWGLAHRDLSGIEAIGFDEIQWRNGHTYPVAGVAPIQPRERTHGLNPRHSQAF